jgi:hypothetical protein
MVIRNPMTNRNKAIRAVPMTAIEKSHLLPEVMTMIMEPPS